MGGAGMNVADVDFHTTTVQLPLGKREREAVLKEKTLFLSLLSFTVVAAPVLSRCQRTSSLNCRLSYHWCLSVPHDFFFTRCVALVCNLRTGHSAAIPIGAHEPAWFMKEQHCSPEEAMTIHKELGSKRSFAVHWVRRGGTHLWCWLLLVTIVVGRW